MRKFTLVAVAASLAVAAPASAAEKNSVHMHNNRCAAKQLKRTYTSLYYKVAREHGKRAPGRNLRRYGRSNGQKATCKDIGRSVRTLRRWLAPPAAPVLSSDRVPTRYRTAPAATGGRYAIPAYIVGRESGGDYNARNPSGAYGAYQIMPFHWAPGGECAGLGKDPAGQDACAAILWDGGRGSQHWAATR